MTPSSTGVYEIDARAVPTEEPRFRLRLLTLWWRLPALIDLVVLTAMVLAAELAAPAVGGSGTPIEWVWLFPALTLGLLAVRGAYGSRRRLRLLEDARLLPAVSAIATMAVITLRVLFTDEASLAAQSIRNWVFAVSGLGLARISLSLAYARAVRRHEVGRPTLIIGAGRIGHLTAKRLLERPELGLRPIGFLDREPLEPEDDSARLPVLGASWDFEDIVARYGVEHVIVTFSTAPNSVLLRLVKWCDELGIGVSLVPRLFEKVTERITVDHIGALPLVTIHPADPQGWQFAVKYGVDRLVAAFCILLALPLLALGAIAVWLSMGRPILYRQLRVERDGRRFEIMKFRSMEPAASELALPAAVFGAAAQAETEEDRLTRVGAFLRRTSIDELPQLFNVLRGDMSLVGPRPERPELVDVFAQNVYRYEERHRVKSGITGWAQVHGIGRGSDRFRGATLADRVEWDNYYIENWSLWLDAKILLMTVRAVLRFGQTE